LALPDRVEVCLAKVGRSADQLAPEENVQGIRKTRLKRIKLKSISNKLKSKFWRLSEMADRQETIKNQAKRMNDGLLKEIYQNARLIFRLLKDPRVSTWLKLLPAGALLYLLTPADFIPINPIDDGLVLWLGAYLFIELCPDEVVQEHREALQRGSGQKTAETPSEVVEGTYRDVTNQER